MLRRQSGTTSGLPLEPYDCERLLTPCVESSQTGPWQSAEKSRCASGSMSLRSELKLKEQAMRNLLIGAATMDAVVLRTLAHAASAIAAVLIRGQSGFSQLAALKNCIDCIQTFHLEVGSFWVTVACLSSARAVSAPRVRFGNKEAAAPASQNQAAISGFRSTMTFDSVSRPGRRSDSSLPAAQLSRRPNQEYRSWTPRSRGTQSRSERLSSM